MFLYLLQRRILKQSGISKMIIRAESEDRARQMAMAKDEAKDRMYWLNWEETLCQVIQEGEEEEILLWETTSLDDTL